MDRKPGKPHSGSKYSKELPSERRRRKRREEEQNKNRNVHHHTKTHDERPREHHSHHVQLERHVSKPLKIPEPADLSKIHRRREVTPPKKVMVVRVPTEERHFRTVPNGPKPQHKKPKPKPTPQELMDIIEAGGRSFTNNYGMDIDDLWSDMTERSTSPAQAATFDGGATRSTMDAASPRVSLVPGQMIELFDGTYRFDSFVRSDASGSPHALSRSATEEVLLIPVSPEPEPEPDLLPEADADLSARAALIAERNRRRNGRLRRVTRAFVNLAGDVLIQLL
ncbi:hypothetical protein J8273_0196 [Carpediemonas membranifera]|uniref:Uncharacterized protein n=1 Tax=Carpediemonas membranifera TaxID=201153 RepID=A0A8J6E2R1_9EUKA|nr:hypothetical protein J8273_0196 [Carpediemonas membranifera]|eukprot:KAG9394988.1 hypothetical protein J8273_0196 [Carpediemonas membranifera]